jgi:hypothetical protein
VSIVVPIERLAYAALSVVSAKGQTAASGTLETSNERDSSNGVATLDRPVTGRAFSAEDFHIGGYQAIELIRLTNLTPLLWVRVDPGNQFGGRFSVFQPDACLAEQFFHDGDAAAQIDAARALAERPLRVQVAGKVNVVYDVKVSELPCRVLGDCLRGTPALHSSLPHTPVVRVQAALAIAQWQNNKAPTTKDAVGPENWVGLNLLVQYFRERFYVNSVVMPCRLFRLSGKKAVAASSKISAPEGSFGASQPLDGYVYFDALEEIEQRELLEAADELEVEEDEEYRVRSAVVTAISCIRAKDHMSPPLVIQFMEKMLSSEDSKSVVSFVHPTEEKLIREYSKKIKTRLSGEAFDQFNEVLRSSSSLPVDSKMLVADMLLSLCNLNAMPATTMDPATGNQVQSSGPHPLSKLLKLARSWLDWELYRENIQVELDEAHQTGISGNTQGIVSACAIIGLSNLVIITLSSAETITEDLTDVGSAQFYIDIFDRIPRRSDVTRAACAQAIICMCCAADRFDDPKVKPNGLLTALELLLSRMLGKLCWRDVQWGTHVLSKLIDESTSNELRLMIVALMMDACTGKVSSMQRVGAYAGRHDLVAATLRFYCGPLGPSHGGDNGNNIFMPASEAVNNGARRGMRLISKAGKDPSEYSPDLVVRVGHLAKSLWKAINGLDEKGESSVCAFDGELRCSLLALWQWLWRKECHALNLVQSKTQSQPPEKFLVDIGRCVETERDRQVWRGEMAKKFYEISNANAAKQQTAPSPVGNPLPPILRDTAFRLGGWIASAAQQRRKDRLDGGTAVKKIRLSTKRADN